MEVKKTERADLENKKGMFLQIGFVIVLAIVWGAFEWRSSGSDSSLLGEREDEVIEEEIMQITRQEEVKPPPPPEPTQVIELNVVEDDVEIEDEFIAEDVEADASTEIEIIEFDEEDANEGEIFMIVEDMPGFGGEGKEGFQKYIAKTLKYPTIASDNGIQGTVYIKFVVNKKGEVTDVVVARGVDNALDKEAVRVVKSSPKWTPGKQRGKPVRVSFIFPIKFKLQE